MDRRSEARPYDPTGDKLFLLLVVVHHQKARGPQAPYQPYAAARSIATAV